MMNGWKMMEKDASARLVYNLATLKNEMAF
jgi:hypothetical protein